MRFKFPSLTQAKSGIKRFIESFLKHDIMTMAAALAFYTALALAPLILITLSVVGLLGEDSKLLLMEQIQGLMGPQAAEAMNSIVESTDNKPSTSSAAGVVGVLVLLFSASGVFAQLQASLNVIWESESKKAKAGKFAWIRKRILSMGMVLSLGFLAMVSLLVSTALSFFFTQDGVFWQMLSALVSGLVFAAMFALIYKYLPDVKLSWKNAWMGGVITTVFFLIGKTLIGLYLGKSAVGSAYGAAGSLIVLLAWVYYSAIVVFSGAEVTRLVEAKDGNLEALQGQDYRKESSSARPSFRELPIGT